MSHTIFGMINWNIENSYIRKYVSRIFLNKSDRCCFSRLPCLRPLHIMQRDFGHLSDDITSHFTWLTCSSARSPAVFGPKLERGSMNFPARDNPRDSSREELQPFSRPYLASIPSKAKKDLVMNNLYRKGKSWLLDGKARNETGIMHARIRKIPWQTRNYITFGREW